jgi:4-diphosphocytidyl-2-C-methyl-D-erythritol kinase
LLTVTAPAKINLTLEVLRKRPDGFHDIRSVFQAIDLADTLYIEPGEGVTCQSISASDWQWQQSLMIKAVGLLREATGVKKGAAIKIDKKIPLMSGLGGDSSDAAATLKGLNEFWGLKLPPEKLAVIGAELGSDVVFFLNGRTALAAGRGERITPLPPITPMWLVLVLPDVPVEMGKTGRMYAGLKPVNFTDGSITQKVVEVLNQGKSFLPAMLYNVFENIAFEDFTIKQLYVEPLKKMGALHVHLAGSGPMLFTMLPDKARAEDIYRRCQVQGMKAFLASTL